MTLAVHRQGDSRGGSHIGWTCLVCDATLFWPPTDPACSVLSGTAAVR